MIMSNVFKDVVVREHFSSNIYLMILVVSHILTYDSISYNKLV